MLFRIKKTYKSSLSIQAIQFYLENLKYRESGAWILRGKDYEVKTSGDKFSIKKLRGGNNGPIYPLIKGRILEEDYVRVDLDIKPSYFTMAFTAIFPCVFLPVIFLSDKMTINGVYRTPDISEKIFFALFSIGLPGILCYFKTIKPTKDAEKWLVNKLSLKVVCPLTLD